MAWPRAELREPFKSWDYLRFEFVLRFDLKTRLYFSITLLIKDSLLRFDKDVETKVLRFVVRFVVSMGERDESPIRTPQEVIGEAVTAMYENYGRYLFGYDAALTNFEITATGAVVEFEGGQRAVIGKSNTMRYFKICFQRSVVIEIGACSFKDVII